MSCKAQIGVFACVLFLGTGFNSGLYGLLNATATEPSHVSLEKQRFGKSIEPLMECQTNAFL